MRKLSASSAVPTGFGTLAGTNDWTGTNRFSGPITFNIGTTFTFDTGTDNLLKSALGLAYNSNVTFANLTLTPGSSRTPASNGDLVIEATNNTTLKFKFKGSDGTVRTATLTLS